MKGILKKEYSGWIVEEFVLPEINFIEPIKYKVAPSSHTLLKILNQNENKIVDFEVIFLDYNEVSDVFYNPVAQLIFAENDNKLTNSFYKTYVGSYVKRFYTPFLKENIFKIIDFKKLKDMDWFKVENSDGDSWWWDVEDCTIISNETPIIHEDRIANVNDERYNGYNPFI